MQVRVILYAFAFASPVTKSPGQTTGASGKLKFLLNLLKIAYSKLETSLNEKV